MRGCIGASSDGKGLSDFCKSSSMQGMNVASIQPDTQPELTEPMKETVEELSENNLEISDKPLDDGALASLSAMFGDNEED
ncbi:MAG: hypothetical protein Q4B53_06905 [Lachnospiraceae bacterium]|nr:hypothetical protein [Lachnospiraceae bacterium]